MMGRQASRNKLTGRERAINLPGSQGSRDLHRNDDGGDPADREAGGRRAISPAAARALAEAEARRKERGSGGAEPSREPDRRGLDPTRYGDWEKGGIVSDF
jgi:hypothetical protein